jgi:hypothetical protein
VLQKSNVLLCCFCGKKTHAKDIHYEMSPVYSGKFLSHKAAHNWVEKFSQGRLKVADDARPGAEMPETPGKRHFYAVGFDALVKRWGKCINVGRGYVEKGVYFPSSNITCFTFYIHL